MTFRFLGLTLLLGGAALWLSRSPEPSTKHFRQPKLPVYFIENQGQVDSSVSYYVHGRRSAAYFTSTSIFYALRSSSRQAGVQLDFLGANPNPAVEAASPTAAVVSYFHGSREQWKTGLPTYSRITYRDLWPGIDLEFAGPEGYLKYTFHVRPGADARLIRLAYRGATSITLTASGSLQIETPAGAFSDDKPIAWQDTSRGRQSVTAAFQLDGEQVRFQLGDFDPSLLLIIDPVVVLYAGYFGGSAAEEGDGIAVDTAGNAYITGATVSAESTLPVVGGPDVTANGNADAFVAKINASGTALLYAGYLGGGSWDYSRSIAVDAAGSAYIAGHTDSNELSFPVTVGPDLTHNGDTDAFVAKVNPTGTALLYAGYVGGATDDFGYGIAVDAAGNAYVTGETASTQATFPAIGGPDLTHNGDMDAFVAKVNAAGTALVYAGFIGGSFSDAGQGIAVDAAGNAYVTGYTNSTQTTFPVTGGRTSRTTALTTPSSRKSMRPAPLWSTGASLAAPAMTSAKALRWMPPATPMSPATPIRPRPPSRLPSDLASPTRAPATLSL